MGGGFFFKDSRLKLIKLIKKELEDYTMEKQKNINSKTNKFQNFLKKVKKNQESCFN